MNNSTTIKLNRRVLNRYFKDSYDPVLHAPFQVGDTVMRCGVCNSIIRAELLGSGACPANAKHQFVPVPVITREEENLKLKHRGRNTKPKKVSVGTSSTINTQRWLRLIIATIWVFSLIAAGYGIAKSSGKYHYEDLFNYVTKTMQPSYNYLLKRATNPTNNRYGKLYQFLESNQSMLSHRLSEAWQSITSQPFVNMFRFKP